MPHRRTWSDLPPAVRARVEMTLGGGPRSVRSCEGGFSTSTADVLTGPADREVFVKAVRRQDNPGAWDMNHREADVLASIPHAAPVPDLLDVFEDGDWFTLVTTVAPGRMPEQPWRPEHLDATFRALDLVQGAATTASVAHLPSVPEVLGHDLRGLERVAADPPADLDPWIAARLPALAESAVRGIPALDGDLLCHCDLRASNLLVAEDGTVTVVDWAWAGRGSHLADPVQLLASIEDPTGDLGLSARLDRVLDRHAIARSVGTDALVGILGFFVDAARFEDTEVAGLQAHRVRRRDLLLPLVRRRWEDQGA
ncbi:phosphotransferase [Brachybacterium sp. AOP25-B2-12]|uniref:phosphotransferase n=1 Tax=Brachybacterium sp. AOP25-B2-12 TaxID=3457710 RepID=UPI004034825E